MKDYTRNNTLYKRLLEAAGDDKLPVLDNKTFESMNAEYGKEDMRKNLSDYIATERPVFPLKDISEDDMRDSFNSLRNFNTNSICTPKDQVDKEVFEKYDDYEYSYDKYGIGLINGPSTYNNAYDIWKCLGPIWRGINDVKKKTVRDLDGTETEQLLGGSLTHKSYMSAFRLGTYIATQFKPVVAKAIYDMTNAKTVLDTSCGWGDRLAGFFASDAEEYYGCDPNPNTYARYTQQISKYNKLLSKPKKVTIWRCGAEDLPYHKLPPIDVAFTSPPYFSTEEYNKGGEFQEDQSWSKFNEYEKWRDEFYLPVAEKSMAVSKFLFVNIMDPKIKGKRYRSSDELVNRLKDKFLGQIGMRIMQRPKSDKLFADEKAKAEFMNKLFIENVWCFGDKDFDLFQNSRKANLDDFFA
jgi:hypothetical protein